MLVKFLQPLKDVLAHHRKFTQFQKVIIFSIFVGVILSILRSWWMLFVSFTYNLTLYASVTTAKYIVTCNIYLSSDVILFIYEKVYEYAASLSNPAVNNSSCQSNQTGTKSEDQKSARNDESDKEKIDDENKLYDDIKFDKEENGSQSFNAILYLERTTDDKNDITVEIHNIIYLIQQDFIESWYKLFSKEKSVLQESETVLYFIVECMKGRLRVANTKKLFEFILLMFKDHIHFVKEAEEMFKVQNKSRRRRSSVKPSITVGSMHSSPSKLNIVYKSIEECYGSKNEIHVAAKSTETEHAYQKSIIEILLVHLLKEDMQDSEALFSALKEILTCNVLQKVMDLLSDTTFLHERIIKITSDEEIFASIESIPSITVSESEPKKVQSILTQRNVSHSSDFYKHTSENLIADAKGTETNNKVKDNSFNVQWKEDTELHSVSAGLRNECNRLCSADKDHISSRPHTCSLGKTPVFFDISEDPERLSLTSFNSVSSTSSTDADFDTKQSVPDELQEPSLNMKDQGTVIKSDDIPEGNKFFKEGTSLSPELPTDEKSLESPSSLDNKSTSVLFPSLKIPSFPSFPFKRPSFKSLSPTLESAVSSDLKNQSKNEFRRSHSQGDFTPVSDDMEWPEERPSVFQDVRITSTETAKERGSIAGTYTLYNVEYEALYQSEDGDLKYKSGTVKRRFKEFINLQSRLEDNPAYKKKHERCEGT